MIIARKYEWLGTLYENDPKSREAIDLAFAHEHIDSEKKDYLLKYNHNNISAFLNLGCGIPGECYQLFMKAFEKLDLDSPYDNGLSFKDVTEVEFESSRRGTAIQLRFVNRVYDLPYRIVGFSALQMKDDGIGLDKGWTMAAPFIVG